MLDAIIFFLLKYTYVFIALLFGTKTFLLLTIDYKSGSFSKFFYYNYTNLVLSSNRKRYRYKKIQNNLTIGILFLVVIQILFLGMLSNLFESSTF